MTQGKIFIIIVIALVTGSGAGFALRPVIMLPDEQRRTSGPDAVAAPPVAPRGTQYFVVHIDEARAVVAGCRDGSVRGGECATAEEAIIKVDAAEHRRKFLGN